MRHYRHGLPMGNPLLQTQPPDAMLRNITWMGRDGTGTVHPDAHDVVVLGRLHDVNGSNEILVGSPLTSDVLARWTGPRGTNLVVNTTTGPDDTIGVSTGRATRMEPFDFFLPLVFAVSGFSIPGSQPTDYLSPPLPSHPTTT